MNWKEKHTSLTVIAIGFAVLYFFFRREWMLVPIGMALIGFLIGPLGEYIHLTWMMMAKVLGYINGRVLLSITFFILLTPIALLMRLLGKGNFLKSATGRNSVFITRNHLYTKADLVNPF